ncbi:protein-lysine N-methyltransferase EEF2KMT-like [Oppia nitens]|uniref:protein-lysine N-methyltransferase EEF2KMT-like n=1 Tax=Oppia nitens TaxID=1686743 RepID=UPI0023D9B626|nr:protein-lysine N-methyltransferase EEF2KMT-like [Oppia nitens]
MDSNDDKSMDMQLISKLFFSKQPINIITDYLRDHIQELSSDETQEQLLNATIGHKLMNKYPLSLKYRQLFAKKVIQLLESEDFTICDTFYILNGHLLSQSMDTIKNNYNFNYLNYVLTSGQIVSLQESNNLVIDGTTGLTTWSAAKHLAYFIECNPHIVKNKNIVELGSGVGMTGICVLKTCYPHSYTFSDHHPLVLQVLQNNIDINNCGQNWRISNIDWFDPYSVDNYLNANDPDIIIASDVTYDPQVIGYLCDVLNKLLKSCHKRRK